MRTFIQEPKNQDFDGGFSITMDCYGHNAETGNRDRFVKRTTARFPSAVLLSDFYENNRKIVFKPKKDEQADVGMLLIQAVAAAVVDEIVREANEMVSA